MARGGIREGAGRPRNARDRLAKEAAKLAAADGIMPLDYMLQVMRDTEADAARRLDAAKSAAPYCHPRTTTVALSGNVALTHGGATLGEVMDARAAIIDEC